MLLFALLLAAQDDAPREMSPAEVMAMHRRLWSANPACKRARDENEIVVCSRREADKYRLPLVSGYNGPDTDQGRLIRLFDGADGRVPCGQGAFLVRCGYVGVGVSVSARGVRTSRRPLAP
jgi:hypothetical protein